MRKYDIKNKRNIGIIIVISVIIIVMFSLVIRLFFGTEKAEFEVVSRTLVFDKDKTIIKVDTSGIIKTKWNNDYYLIYDDNNYDLGESALSYREESGEIILYGKYYEIGSGDEIKVTSDETVIKNSALTKFYKLADRKYLVVDKEIKSADGLVSTVDFLMVDLDKVGNATLTNHKISLKTFAPTEIVTSNYTFDVANEILTYGSDKIDLKKIIGSTNTYTKDDLIPEENNGTGGSNSGVTDVIDGNNGGDNATESGESNTVIEEIKKASRQTSVVSVTPGVSKIDIDYVIYDPYNEYTSVYMEVRRVGTNSIQTIHLNSNATSYTISNDIFPNTKYEIVFKCTYIDPDTSEEVNETIDKVNVTTNFPSVAIKVTNTSFGKITYQITTDNSYSIDSGVMTVLINGTERASNVITINGNTIGAIVIEDVVENDIIEIRLDNIKANGTVINGLKTSTMFKY